MTSNLTLFAFVCFVPTNVQKNPISTHCGGCRAEQRRAHQTRLTKRQPSDYIFPKTKWKCLLYTQAGKIFRYGVSFQNLTNILTFNHKAQQAHYDFFPSVLSKSLFCQQNIFVARELKFLSLFWCFSPYSVKRMLNLILFYRSKVKAFVRRPQKIEKNLHRLFDIMQ